MLETLPSNMGKPTTKPTLMKKRKVLLSEAFRSILASQPKNPVVPILSRTNIEKKLEDSRLDLKAQKIFSLEKKEEARAIQHHVTETDIVLEKDLKKLATRGVVKLFNAVRQAQHVQEQEKPKSLVPRPEEQQEVTKAARTVFLDMLRKRPGSQTTSKLFTDPSPNSEPSNKETNEDWDDIPSDTMLDAKLNDWSMIEEREDDMDLDFV